MAQLRRRSNLTNDYFRTVNAFNLVFTNRLLNDTNIFLEKSLITSLEKITYWRKISN